MSAERAVWPVEAESVARGERINQRRQPNADDNQRFAPPGANDGIGVRTHEASRLLKLWGLRSLRRLPPLGLPLSPNALAGGPAWYRNTSANPNVWLFVGVLLAFESLVGTVCVFGRRFSEALQRCSKCLGELFFSAPHFSPAPARMVSGLAENVGRKMRTSTPLLPCAALTVWANRNNRCWDDITTAGCLPGGELKISH